MDANFYQKQAARTLLDKPDRTIPPKELAYALVAIRLFFVAARLIEKIKNEIPNNKLNGPLEDRLPNNVNFTFVGINGEDLLIKLNEYGVLASTGSACSTNRQKESHVLKAIGLDYEDISGSIRFSLRIQNTVEEIEKSVIILKNSISQLSKLSPLKQKYNF